MPRLVCSRHSDAYFDGDLETQDALARTVAQTVSAHPERLFYRTGSSRFDGQSAIAIYQMTILGLGQVLLEHPEMRDQYLPAMRTAADRLVHPKTHIYAASKYGHHATEAMLPGEGHAYAGYINLALGMLRLHEPNTRHAALHDRLTQQFAERLQHSRTGMVETYPGETWPPDVAAVAASIGLHAEATDTDRATMLDAWAERFAGCAIDDSGYLVQRVRSGSCQALDSPRGSGTAAGAYFSSFANRALSQRLHDALVREGASSYLGFGAIREYAEGFTGHGDVNAGPIVLGMSVGATGFGLGSARAHADRDLFTSLYRSTHLFGVPVATDGGRSHATGGVLGNALLLAMLTARMP